MRLRQMICRHAYRFSHNLRGDDVSVWRCRKCGRVEYRDGVWAPDLDERDLARLRARLLKKQ